MSNDRRDPEVDPRYLAYFEPLPQQITIEPRDDSPVVGLRLERLLPPRPRHTKKPARTREAALYVRRGPEFSKQRAKVLAAILRGKAKAKQAKKAASK